MASSLGSLVVSLGLDAAEFTRGLTKAEFQAQQFAQNTRTAILEVGKVLAGLELGKLVFDAAKAIIAEASALDTLAAATDSSVESLSKLNNQMRLAGGDVATLENALLTLSAGMADANVKGTKTGEALKLLGVSAKDPAQAMQEVVLALDKYADGANKVALINALFGRSNAAFVATLKDMAASQDVQATTTAKQAREAAEFEKALRQLSNQSTTFANLVLNEMVPAITRLIAEFADGIKIAGGFWAALNRFSTLQSTANIEETTKAIASLDRAIEQTRANAAHPILGKLQIGDPAKAIAAFEQQRQFLSGVLARQQKADDALRRQEDRGFTGKPTAPGLPGAGGSRALKEQTSEAQRYLETLEKQNERTLELTHTEQFLRDVQLDRIKGLTPALTDQILKQTQLLDSAEALKKAEEEKKKAAEDAAKAQERINQATSSAIKSAMGEVESIKQGNDQLREQIVFLKGGEEALNMLTDAKLADTIAEKEATLAALQHLEADQQWIEATADQIRLLKERQSLLGDKRAAEAAAAEAKKAKQFADDLGNALAQGAENAILHFNNLRDVLQSLEQDLLRIIARKLVTEPLGNFLSSAISAGLSSGIPAFASGGVSSGGWATVGERGPELVRLPRGAEVIPNSALTSGRSVSVSNTFVLSGPADRRTQDQIGAKAAASIQRAMRKVG